MRSNSNFDWSYLLLFPYMAVAYVPWVLQYVRHRHIAPLLVLWIVIALGQRRQLALSQKGVDYFTGTVLLLVIYLAMGPVSLAFRYGREILWDPLGTIILSSFSLFVFHLSVCNGRLRELRMVLLFGYICFAVTAVMTIAGERVIEGGSRAITSSAAYTSNIGDAISAARAGVGQYENIYGIGLLAFPALFCSSLMPLPMKILFTCLVGVSLVAVYMAAYSICIIGVTLAGILYLMARCNRDLQRLKLFGLIAVTFMVTALTHPRVLIFAESGFLQMADMTSRQEYRQRLHAVADAVSGVEGGYATYRSDLYWMSWKTFVKHPLFGVGGDDYLLRTEGGLRDIGRHSLIFDMLGCYGLLGLTVFIGFCVCHYRYLQTMSALLLGYQWWPAYYIFVFSAVAIGIVNPLGGYIVFADLFLFIPGLVFLFKPYDPGLGGRRV